MDGLVVGQIAILLIMAGIVVGLIVFESTGQRGERQRAKDKSSRFATTDELVDFVASGGNSEAFTDAEIMLATDAVRQGKLALGNSGWGAMTDVFYVPPAKRRQS